MKKLSLPLIGAGAAALAFSIAVGAAGPATVAAAGPQALGGTGTCATCTATVVATTPLTAIQAADLRSMAEEEKVARDLYRAFAARYPSPVWDNIAAAEASHLAAVRTLLSRYGIADPTAGRAEGSFASSAAQALYDKMLAAGSSNELAAFGVGRTVELDDIAKLDAAIARVTQTDVRQVYTNLRTASTAHLRAFDRQLAR
ncbi:MAG: DUF2202 domain-containing protein [Chloroflexota bacterium]